MVWRMNKIPCAEPLCALPAELDLSALSRVLVFAPHPDDESLGCGGTLAILAKRIDVDVKVVLVTDGSGAGELPLGTDVIRQGEFVSALHVLGIDDSVMLNHPDGFFHDGMVFEEELMGLIQQYEPKWILCPPPTDIHRDHRAIAAAIIRICQKAAWVGGILCYEVWTPVNATHVVDITDVLELKSQAISCHATALLAGDYSSCILSLNRYRGLYLGFGRYAEAFRLLKLDGSAC